MESDEEGSEDEEERRRFAFPELDAQIREAVKQYEAVFPKFDFSSPRVSHNTTHTEGISSNLTQVR